ncbi:hypothetical protein [Nonomuraea sp. KM90]|uniref:hypothetical protein n=1 Tax=Nonomuraea sp. KM90 TaxID=3457428 RepID=UPI003FCC78A1
MEGIGAVPRRRSKSREPRGHRVGPLLFDDTEIAALKLVAERKDLDVGAFVALASLAAARQELEPAPLQERQPAAATAEFIQARMDLHRIGGYLEQAAAHRDGTGHRRTQHLLQQVSTAIQRIEQAADALTIADAQQ